MDRCNESSINKNVICTTNRSRKSASGFITTITVIIIFGVIIATSSLSLSYSNALVLSKSASLHPSVVADSSNSNNNNPFLRFLSQEQQMSFLLPNVASNGVISSGTTNYILNAIPVPNLQPIALTQPVFPFIPSLNPSIITTSPTITAASNPLLLTTTQQIPFIQGSSTNGFISFLCTANTVQTPTLSALSFQASSFGSASPLLSPTVTTAATTSPTIPVIGTVTLSNSLGGYNLAGQINSAQVIGNSFTLQGSFTSGGIANTLLSEGLSGFCNTLGSSNGSIITTTPLFSGLGSNQFAITGTCGTNVPLAFTVDRIVIGAYIANVSCNNII
jgi:hypothetical protein